MAWLLSDAVLRCLARRGKEAARRAPLPASLVVLALVGAPVALARATSAVAGASAEALAEPAPTRIVVAALLLPALAAGVAAAWAVPPPDRLGTSLLAGPVGLVPAAVAVALPTALAGLAFAPLAGSVALPFALAAPGRWAAAAALAAGMTAAVVLGAALAGVLSSVRAGSAPAAAALVLLAGAVGVPVVLGRGRALDPTVRVADVLGGRSGALPVVAACAAVVVAGCLTWAVTLGLRGCAHRARVAVRPRRLPFERLPVTALGLALLLRRRESRGSILGGALLGLAATLAGGAVGLSASGSVLLGLSAVLAAVVVAPLSVGSAAGSLRWLLATAPRRGLPAATGLVVAATLATACAPVPLLGLAAARGTLDVRTGAGALAGVLLVVGCGALAGALVPWRTGSGGDQALALTALAAIGAAAAALALGAAWVGERAGLPGWAPATVVTAIPLVAAVAVLARRLEAA